MQTFLRFRKEKTKIGCQRPDGGVAFAPFPSVKTPSDNDFPA
jgi:hypothetical protein